ncbi:uroporphyrinogen decarboxylase family protein, partial [Chloroflexota bacterium]
RIRMEKAPDWYDTPFDQLDFQWSPEEKLEIERYCEKIHKNIEEEEMTPKERFEATLAGKEKDRCFMVTLPFNVYAVRTLDSAADALKPIDCYRNPKLLVKEHFAFAARFKADWIMPYTVGYTEDLWGGTSKLIDYGNPIMVGDAPIKSIEDLEGLEMPDHKKHGLYPGYLWAIRECKRIFVEYNLDQSIPLSAGILCDPVAIVMFGMTSLSKFMIMTRKDPELLKRCTDRTNELFINSCLAAKEMGADILWISAGLGFIPINGNEWTLDYHEKACKTVGSQIPTYYTGGVAADAAWLPLMIERGIMGPGGLAGWATGGGMDYKKAIDLAREYNIHCMNLASDKVVLNGPASTIEEDIKMRCDYGKEHPKFAIGIGAIDYHTPQINVDAAIAAAKKYGKY